MSDDIRARHVEVVPEPDDDPTADISPYCRGCHQHWPCDTDRETARADKAEAALAECRSLYATAGDDAWHRCIERDAARVLADELARALDWALEADAYDPKSRWQWQARAALAKWEASRGD